MPGQLGSAVARSPAALPGVVEALQTQRGEWCHAIWIRIKLTALPTARSTTSLPERVRVEAEAMVALLAALEKLGPSRALRSAMQTEAGRGDDAARRHRMLGALSVDELLARMRRHTRRARRRRS